MSLPIETLGTNRNNKFEITKRKWQQLHFPIFRPELVTEVTLFSCHTVDMKTLGCNQYVCMYLVSFKASAEVSKSSFDFMMKYSTSIK